MEIPPWQASGACYDRAMGNDVVVLQETAAYTLQELAELAFAPLQAAGAVRAVAFGSYARATSDGYADLDLVVVLATDLAPLERASLLRELFDAIPVALDLVIYTPEELAAGIERGIGLFAALASQGVTIYERSTP